MFYIEKISLTNFKNYEELSVSFDPGVNCIVGKNGIGKTNLLDAIYILAFTKSAFNSIDSQLIKHETEGYFVNGFFLHSDEKDFISTGLANGRKKEFLRNKKSIGKITEYIGRYPIVLVTPYDTDLIREGGETRRKFFDGLISQIDPKYLESILKYKALLKNRNSLLKQNLKSGKLDVDLLQVLDDQIIPLAAYINKAREELLKRFTKECSSSYLQLTTAKENIEIIYEAETSIKKLKEQLKEALPKDKMLGRTTYGPHKDDFQFIMNNTSVNKFGSQGQQKSFIIALKLAQFKLIEKDKKIKPILMLDDFFDRIDNERIGKFSQMIKDNQFGQIFITDSHPKRLEESLANIKFNTISI